MRIRHVIVEGPDGSGKSTLVEQLVAQGFTRGAKASTSKGGPLNSTPTQLASWAEEEEAVMTAARTSIVYDRHPVISEPIYGQVLRDKPALGYDDWSWLNKKRLFLYDHTLVVWCLPSLSTLQENVSAERDLAGVADKIGQLYSRYRIMANAWTGLDLRVNPFNMPHPSMLVSQINLMLGGQRVVERV